MRILIFMSVSEKVPSSHLPKRGQKLEGRHRCRPSLEHRHTFLWSARTKSQAQLVSNNIIVITGPARNQPPPRSAIERACSMKEQLLASVERLGARLPPNTLDQLIDELGGPDNVAEVCRGPLLY